MDTWHAGGSLFGPISYLSLAANTSHVLTKDGYMTINQKTLSALVEGHTDFAKKYLADGKLAEAKLSLDTALEIAQLQAQYTNDMLTTQTVKVMTSTGAGKVTVVTEEIPESTPLHPYQREHMKPRSKHTRRSLSPTGQAVNEFLKSVPKGTPVSAPIVRDYMKRLKLVPEQKLISNRLSLLSSKGLIKKNKVGQGYIKV